MMRSRWLALHWGLVLSTGFGAAGALRADDPVATPPAAAHGADAASAVPPLATPYVLLSVRSVDRTLAAAKYVFQTVVRQDVLDSVKKDSAEEGFDFQNLPGLDTQRPVGYLFKLPSNWGWAGNIRITEVQSPAGDSPPLEGELPSLDDELHREVIGVDLDVGSDQQFVETDEGVVQPVDLDEALENPAVIAFGTITDRKQARSLLDGAMPPETTLRPVAGRDDWFEAHDTKSNSTQFTIRLCGNEAYLAESDDLLSLWQVTALKTPPSAIAARHDVQAGIQLGHLTQKARQQFSDVLWQKTAPTLQRKDDEPASEFELRNATSRSMVEVLALLVTGVESAVLAADLQEAEECARAQLEVQAVEGTELAKRLADLKGPQSMFLPLHDPEAALSLSISVQLTDFERELFARWVRFLRACAEAEDFDPDAGVRSSMGLLYDSLQTTIESGHFDLLVQFEIEGPDKVGIVGGLRLAKTSSFRTGLTNLADVVRERDSESGDAGQEIGVEPSHDLLMYHIRLKEELDLGGGEQQDLDIAVGVGRGALWFAGGAIDSRQRLKVALDRMDEAAKSPSGLQVAPPILLTASAAEWQQLPIADDFDAKFARGLAEDAFRDHDQLRIELRPTRRGMRLEGTLQAGFIRWLALTWAKEFDEKNL